LLDEPLLAAPFLAASLAPEPEALPVRRRLVPLLLPELAWLLLAVLLVATCRTSCPHRLSVTPAAPVAGGCTPRSGAGNAWGGRDGGAPWSADADAAGGPFDRVADDGGGRGLAPAEGGDEGAGPGRVDGEEQAAGCLGVGEQ